jgi:hypothetical protein
MAKERLSKPQAAILGRLSNTTGEVYEDSQGMAYYWWLQRAVAEDMRKGAPLPLAFRVAFSRSVTLLFCRGLLDKRFAPFAPDKVSRTPNSPLYIALTDAGRQVWEWRSRHGLVRPPFYEKSCGEV